jgi:hypothetical protein
MPKIRGLGSGLYLSNINSEKKRRMTMIKGEIEPGMGRGIIVERKVMDVELELAQVVGSLGRRFGINIVSDEPVPVLRGTEITTRPTDAERLATVLRLSDPVLAEPMEVLCAAIIRPEGGARWTGVPTLESAAAMKADRVNALLAIQHATQGQITGEVLDDPDVPLLTAPIEMTPSQVHEIDHYLSGFRNFSVLLEAAGVRVIEV